MITRLLRLAMTAALLIIVAACGSTTTPRPSGSGAAPSGSARPTILPIPITQAFRVGDNRILFTLTDSSGQKQVAGPDRTLSIGYHGPGGEAIAAAPQTFVWAIEGVNGVYVGHATFPVAGAWTADFATAAPGSPAETTTFGFDVRERIDTISPGDQAPSVDTPTLADVGGDLARISSDPKPVKRFYETSVDAALAAKEPFVLVFATPKFCQTAQCGPTLDLFKPVAAAHPEVTFINVEPYKLQEVDGQFQPVLDENKQLVAADSTTEWGLLAEPWIFAVDRDGVVRGSYELTISPAELDAIIPVITAGA